MVMAARNTSTRNGAPRQKTVLFCPRCGYESVLPGDWRIEEANAGTAYTCPECDATVVEQPEAPLA
jgi:predicted RNA-binding Zn-ribbon protein involved in translation (DUF1610 family)